MTVKIKMDAVLAEGMVHVINIPHPVIDGVTTEDYVDNALYARNRPGIISFCQSVKRGDISQETHGDLTLLDIVQILFADVVKAKDVEFVSNAVSSVDDAAKAAQAAAKLHAWREVLSKMPEQAASKKLYKAREALAAKLAAKDQEIATLLDKVADDLKLEKMFELTLLEDGVYLTESARARTGKRKKVERVWDDKDTWTWSGTVAKMPNSTAVATIKGRNADDPSKGQWTVTYTVEGDDDAYTGKGPSLHKANQAARTPIFDKYNPEGKINTNSPLDFDVTIAD